MVPFEKSFHKECSCEIPISSGMKVIAKVKVFQKWVKLQGKKLWYKVKGFDTRITHVEYEILIFNGLKVMAKVKVFV